MGPSCCCTLNRPVGWSISLHNWPIAAKPSRLAKSQQQQTKLGQPTVASSFFARAGCTLRQLLQPLLDSNLHMPRADEHNVRSNPRARDTAYSTDKDHVVTAEMVVLGYYKSCVLS